MPIGGRPSDAPYTNTFLPWESTALIPFAQILLQSAKDIISQGVAGEADFPPQEKWPFPSDPGLVAAPLWVRRA